MALNKEQEECLANVSTIKFLELCPAVMRKNGHMPLYIPKKLITEAICIAAVKKDADALEPVPKKLQAKIKTSLNK